MEVVVVLVLLLLLLFSLSSNVLSLVGVPFDLSRLDGLLALEKAGDCRLGDSTDL